MSSLFSSSFVTQVPTLRKHCEATEQGIVQSAKTCSKPQCLQTILLCWQTSCTCVLHTGVPTANAQRDREAGLVHMVLSAEALSDAIANV